ATGLRMNHAYMRIGGLVMDLPEGAEGRARDLLRVMPGRIHEYENLLSANPLWLERTRGVGQVRSDRLLALGVTGPVLRASGVAYDVRRDTPYAGYEAFEFDVPVRTESDCYARYEIRIEEMKQSLR